jgi:hypothetical protein
MPDQERLVIRRPVRRHRRRTAGGGVLKPAAFTAGGGEVIVCESMIDAVSPWCAGFRLVTASGRVSGQAGARPP